MDRAIKQIAPQNRATPTSGKERRPSRDPFLQRWLRLVALPALLICLLLPMQAAAQDASAGGEEAAAEEDPIVSGPVTEASTPNEELTILVSPLTATELAALADIWQGHVKEVLTSTADLSVQLLTAAPAETQALRDQLEENTALQAERLDGYATVLDAWQNKGATPEELDPHRTYISSVRIDAVRTVDFQTLMKMATDWATSMEGGIGWAIIAASVLASLFVLRIIARWIRRILQRNIERLPHISNLLRNFLVAAIYWVILLLGFLFVLALFGVNVTPLFAVFGGLSFILAFALQDSLGNVASGLMIMVLRPFDSGDFITAAGVSGTVDDMNVVSTQLRTADNQIILIPNRMIWNDVITNVNAAPTRRVDMVFGIGYDDDKDHAIGILESLVSNHPLTLHDPEPAIFVGELADNSVNIFCRVWCKTEDYWTVYWDVMVQAKERFDADGISIPFPQREIRVHQVAAPALTESAETG